MYNISDLGVLSGHWSDGYDINNAGQVSGSSSETHGRAFISQNGSTIVTHNDAMGDWSRGFGINDFGAVVGPSRGGGFYYDGNQINLLGTDIVRAFDINNSDQIVALKFFDNPDPRGEDHYTAILWENNSVIPITEVPEWVAMFNTSQAMDINNQGQIVGPFGLYDVMNGIQDIRPPGVHIMNSIAINEHTQIVGGIGSPGSQQAFLWENGSTITLGTFGGAESVALGINDGGQTVGFSEKGDGSRAAFIWENGSLIDLNTAIPSSSGWTLLEANAINNSGQIVGRGIFNGENHGFLLTIVPEPSTLVFFILGGLLTLIRRSRS